MKIIVLSLWIEKMAKDVSRNKTCLRHRLSNRMIPKKKKGSQLMRMLTTKLEIETLIFAASPLTFVFLLT